MKWKEMFSFDTQAHLHVITFMSENLEYLLFPKARTSINERYFCVYYYS